MKYTKEILEKAVKESFSILGVLRKIGSIHSGGMHNHITKRIKFFEIDTSHFTGQGSTKGKPSPRRLKPSEILIEDNTSIGRKSRRKLHRALQEIGILYICNICGQKPIHNEKTLILQIDHIDGNWRNNKQENLRYVCPNCHTQTETFGFSKKKYSGVD